MYPLYFYNFENSTKINNIISKYIITYHNFSHNLSVKMNQRNKFKITYDNFQDVIDKNMGKTEIKVIKYNKKNFKEESYDKCPEINDNITTWIKVTHIWEDKSLKKLFKCLNLNEYAFEKILTFDYIPEVEDYKNYIYLMLTAFIKKDSKIKRIQVSIILGKNYIISLHHDDAELFEPIMNRLKIEEHQIREKGPDYLAYNLIDTVLDSHINTLKDLEAEISKEAEKIMDNPSNDTFRIIHSYREEIDKIRYHVLPLQQLINSMELTESTLIHQSTKTFLQNFRNHVIQVIARIDTLSNRITEIRDIYNSSMSRRLDDIVRVLTVVTVIFAPGTFIVGIYGMNFQFMPELQSPFAYPIVLLINLAIAIGMLTYFRRKQWI